LQRTIRVLPDGTFSFPLVGRVVAQGLKPAEIEKFVSSALAGQYQGTPPDVTVTVQTTAGFSFSVIGRVKGGGIFAPSRYVNVLEAIALAGGGDEFANLDNVRIIHRAADGSLSAERVRLGQAMKGNLPDNIAEAIPEIRPGDTVIVP
jgi:polysaccharide export outer membrane protein